MPPHLAHVMAFHPAQVGTLVPRTKKQRPAHVEEMRERERGSATEDGACQLRDDVEADEG
jgi:hypothetical protein